jgi:hypothetical protein
MFTLKLFFFCLFVFRVDLFDLQLNEACVSSLTKSAGICVNPLSCEQFKTKRNEMNICSFNKTVPIVCCPTSGVRIGDSLKRKSLTSENF